MSNLKPAPLSLSPAVVAKVLGDRPAYGTGIVRVPIEAGPTNCRKCGQTRQSACAYSACPVPKAELAKETAPANSASVPLTFEERRRRLDAAIAFLKARCILVDPVDRMAQVRRYRVSGKRDSKLAEEVIEIAEQLGFEVSA